MNINKNSSKKNLTPLCNPSIIGKTRRHCKMMTIISPLFQHTSSLTSSFVTLALGGILTFNSFARPIKRPHGPIHTWRPTLLAHYWLPSGVWHILFHVVGLLFSDFILERKFVMIIDKEKTNCCGFFLMNSCNLF